MQHNDADAELQISKTLSRKLSRISQVKEAECSIYKVHHHLRDINRKAYEPEIISIGPYHRNKRNLILEEEHKLRYLQQILQRRTDIGIEKLVSVIAPLECKARKCYAERIRFTSTRFVEMLILDGCFIVELLRKCVHPHLREKNDPIFHMDWILNSLQRDLILFENQIPFFVLSELFDLVEAPNQHAKLNHLVFSFFQSMNPGKTYIDSAFGSLQDIKHLLHLIYRNWYISSDLAVSTEHNSSTEGSCSKKKSTEGRSQSIDSATKLREANVKFKRSKECSLHNINFKSGTMLLPPLIVEDRTETLLRNMIAYEQYFQEDGQNPLTDYVMLLDGLIDSSRDIEILCRYKIIENLLGDNAVAANVFNRLAESVTGPRKIFIYHKVFDDVNRHCNSRRNKWVAKLRHNYLNSPWAILSIVVGIIVLLLTFVQAVCSVLQVK